MTSADPSQDLAEEPIDSIVTSRLGAERLQIKFDSKMDDGDPACAPEVVA